METSSQTIAADALRIESKLLRAAEKVGNQAIASAIGKDESLISKWRAEGRFLQTAQVLAACGLKVVPADAKCFKPEYVDSLLMLAKAHLDSMQDSQQLIWD